MFYFIYQTQAHWLALFGLYRTYLSFCIDKIISLQVRALMFTLDTGRFILPIVNQWSSKYSINMHFCVKKINRITESSIIFWKLLQWNDSLTLFRDVLYYSSNIGILTLITSIYMVKNVPYLHEGSSVSRMRWVWRWEMLVYSFTNYQNFEKKRRCKATNSIYKLYKS